MFVGLEDGLPVASRSDAVAPNRHQARGALGGLAVICNVAVHFLTVEIKHYDRLFVKVFHGF